MGTAQASGAPLAACGRDPGPRTSGAHRASTMILFLKRLGQAIEYRKILSLTAQHVPCGPLDEQLSQVLPKG